MFAEEPGAPARSSLEESGARRLRSRSKVTGDWRKAPGVGGAAGAFPALPPGGVEAEQRAGRLPSWCPELSMGPLLTAPLPSRRFSPEQGKARAGEHEAVTREAESQREGQRAHRPSQGGSLGTPMLKDAKS